MKTKYTLALDPSGNYNEGKGNTGWVLVKNKKTLIEIGYISAHTYTTKIKFWTAHINLIQYFIDKYPNTTVIIEDYLLYKNKANNQINSRMETCRLLGLIEWYCYTQNISYKFQPAHLVKQRWSENILVLEKILYKKKNTYYSTDLQKATNRHIRDAIKHAMYATHTSDKKEIKKKKITHYKNY